MTVTVNAERTSDWDDDLSHLHWSWGDGKTNLTTKKQGIRHEYEEPGEYTIFLTAKDEEGLEDTKARTIEVSSGVTADFSYSPDEPEHDERVRFHGEASLYVGDLESWVWSFGGETVEERKPRFSFDHPGKHVVVLTVEDEWGETDSHQETVWVGCGSLLAFMDVHVNGHRVTFDGSKSCSPEGNLTYQWTLGDGNTSTESVLNHTYASEGNYTVELTVNDGDRWPETATREVTINNTRPDPEIDFGHTVLRTNQNVALRDASTDNGRITETQWKIVPGPRVNATPWNTTGQLTAVQFPDDGTYNIQMVSTDDMGARAVTNETVTVRNRAPTLSFTDETVSTNLTVGETWSYGAGGSDPDGRIVEWTWILGNGNGTSDPAWSRVVAENGTYVLADAQNGTHVFAENGTYDVTVKAWDDDGAVTERSTTVTVHNPPDNDAIPVGIAETLVGLVASTAALSVLRQR